MTLGQNLPHDSAIGHVTGRSIYIDDRPFAPHELLVSPLGSPIACGVLKSIDLSEARSVAGVAGIFTAQDLHHNRWGTFTEDQPLLVDREIGYLHEPVCIIAAQDRETLEKAKTKIHLEIEEKKPILSLDEAIQLEQWIYQAYPMKRGDADAAIASAPHRLTGFFECGGQEHFYLESQASIVYPLENGGLEVHSSSQHPTETQQIVAHSLGLPLHKVTCIVKRMGGGFGGKESQAGPIAALAALVAHRLRKPARIVLSKDEDIQITGKRHPFKNFYEVGFDSTGRILGLKVRLYSNGGAYMDLSPSILERAMFHIDGAYYIPNALIEGKVCRTHLQSNTAFRGFGAPQGTLTIESILEDIALFLGLDAFEVRRLNLYNSTDRNITHYGQVVENNTLPQLFEQIQSSSEYHHRLKDITDWNRSQTGTLRGISLTAVKFGIAFTARFMNQGNALVNLHRDGSVQVSTGATEMGQGVNTKIRLTVAHEFSIPPENVEVMPTSTEKNHNTSPTAGSSGADLNCAAAQRASEAIKSRLRWIAHLHFSGAVFDFVKECPAPDPKVDPHSLQAQIQFKDGFVLDTLTGQKLALKDLLDLAYFNRISLAEYSHFRTEGLGFDKKSGKGTPYKYFTQGVAVSEVTIDEYTGQYKVPRVDILMDLGRSIHPGIDRGQITGAFVQGMGWLTTENLFYTEQGKILSYSPTTYKIPNIQDTPRDFRVHLFENHRCIDGIYGSKAVGEPPLLLASSVWTALKHALSFRSGKSLPHLACPALPEKILMELDRYERKQF